MYQCKCADTIPGILVCIPAGYVGYVDYKKNITPNRSKEGHDKLNETMGTGALHNVYRSRLLGSIGVMWTKPSYCICVSPVVAHTR